MRTADGCVAVCFSVGPVGSEERERDGVRGRRGVACVVNFSSLLLGESWRFMFISCQSYYSCCTSPPVSSVFLFVTVSFRAYD